MENYENELNLQPEPQPVAETVAQALPQEESAESHKPQTEPATAQSAPTQNPQPQPQPHAYQMPYQQPPQNAYHGAAVNYYPYQVAYQQPWQPAYQYPVQPASQQPVQPQPQKKPQKKSGKVLSVVLAAVVMIFCVVAGCAFTARLCTAYYQSQNALLMQNMEEKVAALQQQINSQNPSTQGGGVLQPGQTLTAAQIYAQNVNSVVCVTTDVGVGTGFIITEDGYIVTNHHVIEGASRISVNLADGTKYNCMLVGSDKISDVAVLKAKAVALDPVALGSSDSMQVGDQVVAIGNVLGELASSLTVGYISGIDRNITTDGTAINMIQTDVAINSGNSGGPLFNARGEVIGITTAKYSGTTSTGAIIEGISFAIPMDDVIDLIEDLRDFGYIKSASLGVLVWEVDANVAETYNFPQGVYVEEVTVGSCAETAGVEAKDIIIELGGYKVKTLNDLSRALRNLEPGQTVTMIVWRSGQQIVLEVTLDQKAA